MLTTIGILVTGLVTTVLAGAAVIASFFRGLGHRHGNLASRRDRWSAIGAVLSFFTGVAVFFGGIASAIIRFFG